MLGLVDDAELLSLARALDRADLLNLVGQLDRDGLETPSALVELLRNRWRAAPVHEPEPFVFCRTLAFLLRRGVELGPFGLRGWRAALERATRDSDRRWLFGLARPWPALRRLVRDDPGVRRLAVDSFALPLADLVDLLGEEALRRRVEAHVRALDRWPAWRLHGALGGLDPLARQSSPLAQLLLDLAFSGEHSRAVERELGRLLARSLRPAAAVRALDALEADRSHAAVDGVLSVIARVGPLVGSDRALLLRALGASAPAWRARAAERLRREEDVDGACARRCQELLADADRAGPPPVDADPFPEARLLARAARARGGDAGAIAVLAGTARADARLGELALAALADLDVPAARAVLVEALDLPWELPCGCCPEPRLCLAARALGRTGGEETAALLLERYWRVASESHADTLHGALVTLLRVDEPGSLSPCAAPAS